MRCFKDISKVSSILKALGTGVSAIKKEVVAEENLKQLLPKDIFIDILNHIETERQQAKKGDFFKIETIIKFKKAFFEFIIDENDNFTAKTIKFCHENPNISFDLKEESDGTMKLLDVIDILFNPKDDCVYIFDEIDRCLHPYLTSSLFKFFLKIAPKRNCQIISTLHEAQLLVDDLLRPDEICLFLKNEIGATQIHSLDEYKLHNDKRIYKALFDGTIAARPSISDEDIYSIYNSYTESEQP